MATRFPSLKRAVGILTAFTALAAADPGAQELPRLRVSDNKRFIVKADGAARTTAMSSRTCRQTATEVRLRNCCPVTPGPRPALRGKDDALEGS